MYELDSWSAEKFFNKREELVKEKESEAAEKPGEGASEGGLPEGISIPGIPGASIPGVEAVQPESEKALQDPEPAPKEADSE